MKKYIVTNKRNQEVIGYYTSKSEAAREMQEYIENCNEHLDESDEEYVTPFDFSMEVDESQDINEKVVSFDDAMKYLGINYNTGFPIHKVSFEKNGFNTQEVIDLIEDLNPKHIKAIAAMSKLFTIAQAWNQDDGFVPDFSDGSQRKWFPWFVYDKKSAGFVYAFANDTATYTYAYYGSRLCFKTSERAKQFGEQFIDLWNDVLLFR